MIGILHDTNHGFQCVQSALEWVILCEILMIKTVCLVQRSEFRIYFEFCISLTMQYICCA